MLEKGAGVYALAGLIKLYTSKGKDSQAEAAVETILSMYPDSEITVSICSGRAAAFLRSGDYQQAAELYKNIEDKLTQPEKQ
jgi:hypothetical protein